MDEQKTCPTCPRAFGVADIHKYNFIRLMLDVEESGCWDALDFLLDREAIDIDHMAEAEEEPCNFHGFMGKVDFIRDA